jgi:hypothetical protein
MERCTAGDAGAAGIAAGLAGNASIEELDLHGDAIGYVAAAAGAFTRYAF